MGNCNDGACETGKQGCGCGGGCKGGCGSSDMTGMLTHIADKAWEQLMVEKMKGVWEQKRGKNMEKMAAAAVDASMAYWQHKMAGQQQCHEHKEKLRQAMSN